MSTVPPSEPSSEPSSGPSSEASGPSSEPAGPAGAVAAWLRRFLDRHGGTSGTVHLVDDGGATMRLAASVNIPDKVLELTAVIPKGRGMGGLAWERGRPVATCDLKTDSTGDIRVGARAVDAHAAIAFPLGAPVRAVVGIAWKDRAELDDAQTAAVTADVADFPA